MRGGERVLDQLSPHATPPRLGQHSDCQQLELVDHIPAERIPERRPVERVSSHPRPGEVTPELDARVDAEPRLRAQGVEGVAVVGPQVVDEHGFAEFWAASAPPWQEPAVNRESIPGFGAVAEVPRATSRALDTPCAWLAWGLPLIVGIGAARAEPGWADDVGILRDLGFARLGFEGGLSTLLAQLLALVPIGSRFLRLSLLGVLALAVASRLLFECIRGLLDRRGRASIHPLLALLSSSLWALGPAVLAEATRAGGALVAVALVLLVLRLLPEAFEAGDARALTLTGLGAGAALAECHAAGAIVALVLAAAAFAWRDRSWPAHAGRLVASLGFAFALASSLRWVTPGGAPLLPTHETLGLAPAAQGAAEAALRRVSAAFAGGFMELGPLPLAFAVAGAALAASRGAALRRVSIVWLALAASGVLAALSPSAAGSPTAATPSALFALAPSLALAAFFPVALAQALEAAWRARLPFGRHAAVLLVTFAATLVLGRVDRAVFTRSVSSASSAVEAWTDTALGGLPARSLLLVQTPPLARRLLASRVLSDTRPDVELVPASLVSAGSIGRELSRSDPSAAPLLRQLYVNGSADEYSLSSLADERPVFVELDRAWDRRLLEHLEPAGVWLKFAPALVASERGAAAARVSAELRRCVELSGGEDALDLETRRVLADAIGAQALVLTTLDRAESARLLLGPARRLDSNSPLVREALELSAASLPSRVAASGRME